MHYLLISSHTSKAKFTKAVSLRLSKVDHFYKAILVAQFIDAYYFNLTSKSSRLTINLCIKLEVCR